MKIDAYLQRLKIVNGLIASGEWKSQKVRNLINAVFGSEKACERFLMNATEEELDQILVAEGIDIDAMNARVTTRLSEIRARIDMNEVANVKEV